MELLVFELAGVKYAFTLACVREVTAAVFITPLPAAPPVIEGVIDVRGEIVPVYDLRLRFGHAAVPLDPAEQMIIASTGERLVAVRCERTDWIRNVESEAIGTAGEERQGPHIMGVARLPDGLVLIQDLAAFLDAAERERLGDALAAAGGEARE